MRNRGKVYWDWADPAIHVRTVNERMPDGTFLDVQVRMSALWETQLFVGVYAQKGMMLFEEAFDSRPGETMTLALEWGLNRAREKSPAGTIPMKKGKAEALPRSGSRQKN
ncbi:hypothetical protein [Pseudomonas fluorescens]